MDSIQCHSSLLNYFLASSLPLTEDDLSKLPLGDLALWSLHQICSQDWVRDRCLQVPDDLFSKHILLDPEVKPHQAQSLLRMICHMQVSLFSFGRIHRDTVL